MNTQHQSSAAAEQEELFSYLKSTTGELFAKRFRSSTISLRSLDPEHDLRKIHKWVCLPYAKRFWQLDVGFAELHALYSSVMQCRHTHSIVAVYNNQLVAQVDLYHAPADEVSKCYAAGPNDYGIHFLMAPATERIPSFSTAVFSTAVEWLFGFACVQRIIGEPDSLNEKANALVQRVGFRFQHPIALPDKLANLYFCKRSDFIPAF